MSPVCKPKLCQTTQGTKQLGRPAYNLVDLSLPWTWGYTGTVKHCCQPLYTVKLLSHIWFCNPWTAAHQAPLSMGFSSQGYWSALPFPSPGDLPNPGIKPRSPILQADSLQTGAYSFPIPKRIWGHVSHFSIFLFVSSWCLWINHSGKEYIKKEDKYICIYLL